MPLKVGELAKRTGLSVRTLHHYDEIGLLSPSLRTESGHRLYTDSDVARLQQVISLRSLGFSLDEIAQFLNAPSSSPLQILEMHLGKLQSEMEERVKLIESLEKIAGGLRSGQNPTVDELLNLIEDTTMFEKYYSKEQMDQLQERAKTMGPERMNEAQNDWAVLIQEVKLELEKGSLPESASVQSLARRWRDLIEQFTGGDAGIAQSLGKMHKEEGAATASRGMMDSGLSEYISKAIALLPPEIK